MKKLLLSLLVGNLLTGFAFAQVLQGDPGFNFGTQPPAMAFSEIETIKVSGDSVTFINTPNRFYHNTGK